MLYIGITKMIGHYYELLSSMLKLIEVPGALLCLLPTICKLYRSRLPCFFNLTKSICIFLFMIRVIL